MREIADKADVSPTTVFAHFPQKEALLFCEDEDQRQRLVAAVRDRPADVSISEALAGYYRSEFVAMWSGEDGELRGRVMAMMGTTPTLQEYASRMWLRHEEALGAVITEEFGLPEPSDEIRIYARFALQIQLFVTSDTHPILEVGLRVRDQGWPQYQEKLGVARTRSTQSWTNRFRVPRALDRSKGRGGPSLGATGPVLAKSFRRYGT